MYIWAHPSSVIEPMDALFFQSLLRYVSNVTTGKAKLDPFQIMTTQHASATALVWFPRATWLGPLRWWVPWKIQGAFAWVGGLMGYTPVIETYVDREDWEGYVGGKKKA
ncbi:hypothetical protein BCR34DRAFT_596064 [Clohesyomyces aquaticus]|uniref:Uncharacterized protein n=1 Tax=Clohesyomyces aquaticus TaxID=1231657 RepID=A0A1Y2A8K7_9PLEO|nr:hypothetical protein BCR34DRAFT_596064 [Clohesyomyces aquaticus]